ncbi:MAG: FHA domain-containing protein [Archangium sp.]|nr:FHA domain-containing protein [Archangium sp.]
MSQGGYALKFISGKYQGGEFPLKPDKPLIIGRSSELDMVLVEDMVSRKHAKISWQGDKPTIEDLGSTNGTFVNGEKIQKPFRIKEGDRILIGTSILKLVVQGANAPDLSESQIKQQLENVAAVQSQRAVKTAMTGKLEEVPLPDLLQLFHTSKKNGVLVVNNGGQEARVYLRQGRVYYSVINDNHELGPQKSFNRIVSWEVGEFELRPPDEQEFMVEMDTSTEGLLMDALRQLDEMRRIQTDLPASDATLALAVPMNAPMRDLKSDELDVLQLVLNWGTLNGVLDHSDKDDVTVATTLVGLMSRDYVRAS